MADLDDSNFTSVTDVVVASDAPLTESLNTTYGQDLNYLNRRLEEQQVQIDSALATNFLQGSLPNLTYSNISVWGNWGSSFQITTDRQRILRIVKWNTNIGFGTPSYLEDKINIGYSAFFGGSVTKFTSIRLLRNGVQIARVQDQDSSGPFGGQINTNAEIIPVDLIPSAGTWTYQFQVLGDAGPFGLQNFLAYVLK